MRNYTNQLRRNFPALIIKPQPPPYIREWESNYERRLRWANQEMRGRIAFLENLVESYREEVLTVVN